MFGNNDQNQTFLYVAHFTLCIAKIELQLLNIFIFTKSTKKLNSFEVVFYRHKQLSYNKKEGNANIVLCVLEAFLKALTRKLY